MQIDNMISVSLLLDQIARSRRIAESSHSNTQEDGHTYDVRVVEFCSGSGYVSIPLGCLLPHMHLTLVDCNPVSIAFGTNRINECGLGPRAETETRRIEDIDSSFDIGIALHACGGATDVSLQK